MKFNFEQPQEKTPSPEKILSQIETSFVDYADALEKLRADNTEGLNFLIEMQQKLVAWREELREHESNLHAKGQLLSESEEEIFRQVNARLFELSEELQKLERDIK